MNVQHLDPLSERGDKILEIKSDQIGMSRVETESKHLSPGRLIQPVDAGDGFCGVTAGAFHDTVSAVCIDIFHTDRNTAFFRQGDKRLQEFLRPLPLLLFRTDMAGKFKPVHHDVRAVEKSAHFHAFGSHHLCQILVDLLWCTRHETGVGHMHLVDPNAGCPGRFPVPPEKSAQRGNRPVEKVISSILIQFLIGQIGIEAEITAGKPRLAQHLKPLCRIFVIYDVPALYAHRQFVHLTLPSFRFIRMQTATAVSSSRCRLPQPFLPPDADWRITNIRH